MPSKDVKKSSSKKLETPIIVAFIALLGTLVTALFSSPVIIELIRNKATPTAFSSQPQSFSNASTPVSVASAQPLAGGDADCLEQYFADIDPTRQISIEVGVRAQDYYLSTQNSSNQNFLGPFGIRLTQTGKMIGALSFLFFTDSQLFKIISVVDSSCQAVTEYTNASRGGDKNAIQNSDNLKIQLAEGIFTLHFQFSGTDFIRFQFLELH